MSSSQLIRALALSCHPTPSVAVTAISAGLVALADLPIGRGALVTGTVFTGQLSIGWSNDYLDAERDRAVLRSDKPVATGAVEPRVAGIAAVVALVLTLALSAALGWPGGAAAMATVACAWAYNLGLKATVLSWLPYAIAFGMLPAVATLSALPPRWPAAWTLTAGGLLGVAAHLANVLPDLGDDVATGIRGPVATSSPRSGSTLARWAATPSNPPAVSVQAAGHRGGEADRVATAGSIPKAMAYGSQDRTVAFRPRL